MKSKDTSSPDTDARRMPRLRRVACALLGIALTVGGVACASPDVEPVDQLVEARAAILKAEAAGADATAPLELLAAREKIGEAESAARNRKYVRALALAEEAQADATLAEEKARAIRADYAATEAARELASERTTSGRR